MSTLDTTSDVARRPISGRRVRLGDLILQGAAGIAAAGAIVLVGLFLVFTTLVVPALSTFYSRQVRLLKAYGIGVLGYAAGLLVSVLTDLPSGAMIVCALVAVGVAMSLLARVGLRTPG